MDVVVGVFLNTKTNKVDLNDLHIREPHVEVELFRFCYWSKHFLIQSIPKVALLSLSLSLLIVRTYTHTHTLFFITLMRSAWWIFAQRLLIDYVNDCILVKLICDRISPNLTIYNTSYRRRICMPRITWVRYDTRWLNQYSSNLN